MVGTLMPQISEMLYGFRFSTNTLSLYTFILMLLILLVLLLLQNSLSNTALLLCKEKNIVVTPETVELSSGKQEEPPGPIEFFVLM
jgi:hypothetical protein